MATTYRDFSRWNLHKIRYTTLVCARGQLYDRHTGKLFLGGSSCWFVGIFWSPLACDELMAKPAIPA